MITRRSFLLGTLCASTAALTIGTKVYNDSKITTEDISLQISNIKIPDLPSSFDGYRIGVLSDPHISNCGGILLLQKAISLLADANLDILVLAGDYVLIFDIFTSRYFYTKYSKYADLESCVDKSISYKESLEIGQHNFEQVVAEVSRLNPKDGIIGVLGNHDRWNSADNCIKIFKKGNIPILVNQGIRISKGSSQIEFYGCDDYGTGIPLAPKSDFNPRIMISHNPDFLAEMASQNCYSLGIAGHTHGGQIALPLIGPLGLNIQNAQLLRGLTRMRESQILVSTGVGTSGIPFRINCPPEVNLIILNA